MASSADYEPNNSPRGVIGTSRCSLHVRDEVTFDDFSAAMLLGANFRTLSDSVDIVDLAQCSKSSQNVGPALQLSQSPLRRQFFELSHSLDELGTPSRAEGVANHATNRV